MFVKPFFQNIFDWERDGWARRIKLVAYKGGFQEMECEGPRSPNPLRPELAWRLGTKKDKQITEE